jgi:adenine-specific DNA-methyltransferase
VAQFLASWAVRSPSASVLEPSAGDGVFIRAAYEVFARLGQVSGHVVGIEIDGPTVDALLEMAPDTATIIQSDFFCGRWWWLRRRDRQSAVCPLPALYGCEP